MTPSLLIVEDDEPLRTALSITLRACGYQVTGSGTGGEAMTLVDSVEFGCVILDLGLPDMDGIEAACGARAQFDAF